MRKIRLALKIEIQNLSRESLIRLIW